MWQELIITDVTRMKDDRVCIAGVDRKGNCYRPLLSYPEFLCEHHLYDTDSSVMIRPRAVVNLFLEPISTLKPPHNEDHLWRNQNQVEFLRLPDESVWRTVMERTAHESVEAIFHAKIHKNKYIAPGDGERSLGTIKPISIDKLGFYRLKFGDVESDKFSLNFTDSTGVTYKQIPVTDLSLRYYIQHLRTQKNYHPARIRSIIEQKFSASEVWLRLGLTRPFQKTDNDKSWCYIQVTGIYTFPDYLNGACFADYFPILPQAVRPVKSELVDDYRREGRDDRQPEFSEVPEEW